MPDFPFEPASPENCRITMMWGSAKLNDAARDAFLAEEVVPLNESSGDLIEVFADNRLYARGQMVQVEGRIGVRITELIAPVGVECSSLEG